MPNLQAPASTEKKIWPASKGRTVEGTSVSFRCVAYAHAQFTHTPACWPFFLRGGSLVAREKARGGRQAREAPERVVGKGLGADIRGRRAADPPTFRHKCGTSAEQVRNKCGTSAEQVRHKCGTSAAQVRIKCGSSADQVRSTVQIACGTGAERRRMCGAASSAENDQKRLLYLAITQNGNEKIF